MPVFEKFQPELLEATVEVLRKRLKGMGFAGAEVSITRDVSVHIFVPGLSEEKVRSVRELVEVRGEVRFRLTATPEEQERFAADPGDLAWFPYRDRPENKELVHLEDRWNLGGEIILDAFVDVSEPGPAVHVGIKPERQDAFFDLTSSNSDERLGMGQGRRLAILLDDHVLIAPVLEAGVRSSAMITGNFKEEDADNTKECIIVENRGRA